MSGTIASLLTDRQQRGAAEVLHGEAAKREHLVVMLTGVHAYGFPSPDSDVDVFAIHVAPTARFLGLGTPELQAARMSEVDGVEVDYVSNEIGPVLDGILGGNGNYIERVLSELTFAAAPEHEALKPLVRRALSRRIHRHYRGFAVSQFRKWEKDGARSAKRILYVLRTALTGAHALRTGEVVSDLTALMDEYGFADARELILAKRPAEKAELPVEMAERWRAQVPKVFETLDACRSSSPLPEAAPNAAELDEWLVALRRGRL